MWQRLARLILAVLALTGAGQPAHALAPPAGSSILNVAEASYFDEFRGVGARAQSNPSLIRVAAVAAFEVTEDRSAVTVPGSVANLTHLITNTGNTDDDYQLTVERISGFEPGSLRILLDVNGNGIADPGETAVSSVALMPGESVQVIVEIGVPGTLSGGSTVTVDLAVTSTSVLTLTNTDVVTTGEGAQLRLSKTPTPICEIPVEPGGNILYTILVTNFGNAEPANRTVMIDGSARTGILIEDVIPANTRLIEDQELVLNPIGSIAVVHQPGAAEDVWVSFDTWTEDMLIDRVGSLIPDASLSQNETAEFAFNVAVSELITPGTVINNTARISFLENNGIAVSPETCNTVAVSEGITSSARIRFLEPIDTIRRACSIDENCDGPRFDIDDDFQDAGVYRTDSPQYRLIRDGIYLEVFSTSLNLTSFGAEDRRVDGLEAQSITVTLRSQGTGDLIEVVMLETGPNTGRFRSVRPIRLSSSLTGSGAICPSTARAPDYQQPPLTECTLQVIVDDNLEASIVDADGNQTQLVDRAVVDPLGIVFDSVTMRPVAGATVSIRNLDGSLALNPDTGGTTVLEPQTTGDDGFYQYPRVFPGDYFLRVEPPDDYSHPSVVAADTFTGIFDDVNEFSYGRNGFSGIPDSGVFTLSRGDPLLFVDIPIDPDPTSGHLAVEKTSVVTTADIGDFVPYEVNITNTAGAVLVNITAQDDLPPGFRYVAGTARTGGVLVADPAGGSGPSLTFPIERLGIGEQVTLTYLTEIGPGALRGDGVNRINVTAQAGSSFTLTAPEVIYEVKLQRDPLLSDKAYLVGKTFIRSDCDDNDDPVDLVMPGVRLYLDDGTWAVTDANGNYSFYGLDAGFHVVKLDHTTLPEGVRTAIDSNRQIHDPGSHLADLRPGELHRADFPLAINDCESLPLLTRVSNERRSTIHEGWLLDDILNARDSRSLTNSEAAARLDRARVPANDDGDISSGLVSGPRELDAPLPDTGLASEEPAVATLDLEMEIKKAAVSKTETGKLVWPSGPVSRNGRFAAVLPADLIPELWINDEPVGADKLGDQIVDTTAQLQIVAWYGVQLSAGSHKVTLRTVDSFGNPRLLDTMDVQRPGRPVTLVVTSPRDTLNADGGKSLMPIHVRLIDASGVPVSGVDFVTLDANLDSWLENDPQPLLPGHQLRLTNGEGKVHIRSGFETGPVEIAARTDSGLESKLNFNLVTPSRPLIGAGLIELSLRDSDQVGSQLELPPGFSDKRIDGSTRFFLKGRVRGDHLLTLAYDSDFRRNDELFRDIDPNAYYPVYGDASIRGYDAQSRSPLYLRLEKQDWSLLWGDYRTDFHDDPSLGRQQLTLTGFKATASGERFGGEIFAAATDSRRREETLRGQGTATGYLLTGAPFEQNSENVSIITRDRDNTSLVIGENELSRFTDYSVDHLSGRLSFADVVPAFDPELNPVFVRVSYDTVEDGTDDMVAGARLKYQISKNVILSHRVTHDSNDSEGYTLGSVALHAVSENLGELTVEAGRMLNAASDAGNAKRIEWQRRSGRVSGSVTMVEVDQAYAPRGAIVAPGNREIKVDTEVELPAGTNLIIEGIASEALDSESYRRAVMTSVARRTGDWRLETGIRHTQQSEVGSSESFNSLNLRAERGFTLAGRQGSGHIGVERALNGADRDNLQFGLEYQLMERAKLYARQESITSLGGFTAATPEVENERFVIGAEAEAFRSTTSYSEYRVRSAANGRDLETASGIRSSLAIFDGFNITPQYEWINTLEGETDNDTHAFSVGIRESTKANRRILVRMDARLADDVDIFGFQGTWIARLDDDWTGYLREEYSGERRIDRKHKYRNSATIAASFRPFEGNRTHHLFLFRRQDDAEEDLHRRLYLASWHQNTRLGETMTLTTRLAGKRVSYPYGGESYLSRNILGSARWLIDITSAFDLDLHGAVLFNRNGQRLTSYGIGFNANVARNLRVGIGYNFEGFDDGDLDDSRHHIEGVYLGLQYKFDEMLFDFLSPAADTSADSRPKKDSRN